jgi:23S rRNA pseudouridine2605 synthase
MSKPHLPPDRGLPAAGERLQNVLAQRGLASRRHAAELIAAGRVTVAGQTVREPGWRVTPETDEIRLDGRLLPVAKEAPRTILLYKPRGVICSADNTQGETVCDLVRDLPQRLVPVGRLDKASEGLILLSNDGDLILRLTHPRHGHLKRYEVTVTGRLTSATLEQLGAPLELDGYRTHPARVEVLRRGDTRHVLALTLSEGRNHQIKRLCGRAGLFVTHLLRTSVAELTLAGLRPGEWRDLTPAETAQLQRDSR